MTSLLWNVLPLLVVSAQDPGPAPVEEVRIEPEDVLVEVGDLYGRIVAIDGDDVRLEFPKFPGSRATVGKELVPADKLYLYRKAKIDEDDAGAWMDLARFAQEHDLYVRRIEALRTAAELDPSLAEPVEQKVAETRSTCAADRLERARELRDAGELDDAVRHLEQTIEHFGACVPAEKARDLLADIRDNIERERRRATEIEERRRATREADANLSKVNALIEKGDKHLQRALRHLDDFVTAEEDLEDALTRYRAARDRLEELAARTPDEQSLPARIRRERQRLMRTAKDKMVRAHVELGHVYVGRGDDQSAYRHVGRAAALDPGNPRISALRTAIAAGDDGALIR